MSFFYHLPIDIQREVFYLLDKDDYPKVLSKILTNEDDYFWKMLVKDFTFEIPQNMTYRQFYDYLNYEKVLKLKRWNLDLLETMLKDIIFITRCINVSDAASETALMYAVSHGTIHHVKKLLKSDINKRDVEGNTALYLALKRQDRDIINLLLDQNPDVNLTNRLSSPLSLAVSYSDASIVERLINLGANVNYQRGLILKLAVTNETPGRKSIVEKLLAAGADTSITYPLGTNILDIATLYKHRDVYEILQKNLE